ncbi:ecdysone receptor A isoform [Trichonephila clavipes]|nr:ecdysone receptor A isoform [Trichonephila clavipes]
MWQFGVSAEFSTSLLDRDSEFVTNSLYVKTVGFTNEVVGRLLNKNGTIPFPGRSSWDLQRPVPSPPQMGEAKAYNLKMLRDPSPAGGALAGQASPPALSPNLPSIVKMEPRLPSPCNGDPFSPSKRTKQEDGTWLPSPSQMSIDSSVSPPPLVNGHSPTSSYDAYCSSKGKQLSIDLQIFNFFKN